MAIVSAQMKSTTPFSLTDFIADDEIQEQTALTWLAEFLTFAQEVMVPFTPRLLPAILPNLAHHVHGIQAAAVRTNKLLSGVIQALPSPHAVLRTSTTSPAPSRQTTMAGAAKEGATLPRDTSKENVGITRDASADSLAELDRTPTPSAIVPKGAPRGSPMISPQPDVRSPPVAPLPDDARPMSPTTLQPPQPALLQEEPDPFDYQVTVNALTIQFLSEHEDTRVAALKWLIMLHQKAPKKVRYDRCWFMDVVDGCIG